MVTRFVEGREIFQFRGRQPKKFENLFVKLKFQKKFIIIRDKIYIA